MFWVMFYALLVLSTRSLMTEVTMYPLINLFLYVCDTQVPVRHRPRAGARLAGSVGRMADCPDAVMLSLAAVTL